MLSKWKTYEIINVVRSNSSSWVLSNQIELNAKFHRFEKRSKQKLFSWSFCVLRLTEMKKMYSFSWCSDTYRRDNKMIITSCWMTSRAKIHKKGMSKTEKEIEIRFGCDQSNDIFDRNESWHWMARQIKKVYDVNVLFIEFCFQLRLHFCLLSFLFLSIIFSFWVGSAIITICLSVYCGMKEHKFSVNWTASTQDRTHKVWTENGIYSFAKFPIVHRQTMCNTHAHIQDVEQNSFIELMFGNEFIRRMW